MDRNHYSLIRRLSFVSLSRALRSFEWPSNIWGSTHSNYFLAVLIRHNAEPQKGFGPVKAPWDFFRANQSAGRYL